ncbi:FMN-linked oxidoreductase [Sphaerosporella brunnea]|uniref:FMN-linked oxidoreductase n=1 Tax=Sphaerosporella brunnea TaxID=1250544 RepID=A0A5J5EF48_9PEZI|nr:FMN-linked oxidoreductase [Sphaerosporella brunnea]
MATETPASALRNEPAPNVPYFTPAQIPPAGTAFDPQSDGSHPPTLFKPFKIRGATFQNRIMLSPLCQYSADNGKMTPWHLAHLGGIFTRGPALSIQEATAVLPEGRISPEDVGIWDDSQLEYMSKIVQFAHSQNQKMCIQLAHAGRKASCLAPWLSTGDVATKEQNGWPDNVYGPSAIPYNERHAMPKEMTKADIERVKQAFVDATRRAVKIGYDVIEIHNAHGYLLHSFLSPASNQRTDEYGGSFENRTRLTLEIAELVRKEMPKDMPLFLRISADDWLDPSIPSWTVEQSARLAPLLAERGVDLIDVSSGGLDPRQKIKGGPGYQVHFAKAVREAVKGKALVSAVGSIDTAHLAQSILDAGSADVIMVGRGFQKNPGIVWAFADELGVEMKAANQMGWGFGGRAGGRKKKGTVP